MRPYELIYIIKEGSSEEVEKVIKKVKSLIEKEGKLTKEDIWERKKLAYSIAKQDYGFYVILNFQKEPSKLSELEKSLKLDENIIRYLLISQPVALPPHPEKKAKLPIKEAKLPEKEKIAAKKAEVFAKIAEVPEKKAELPEKEKPKKPKLPPKLEVKPEKVEKVEELVAEEVKEKERMTQLEEKLKEILEE